MMRADIASAISIGAMSLLLATSGMAAPAAKLSPDEIKATFFNGQAFTASTPSNVKFKMTFTADGKMKRQPAGGGKKGEGTCAGGQRRRQQMVGAQGLGRRSDVSK